MSHDHHQPQGQPFAPASVMESNQPAGGGAAAGRCHTQKDLLRLLRAGASPQFIVERMDVAPSRLRRMLEGPRLKTQLELEARLAAASADHRALSQLQDIAERLRELTWSEKEETARKACTDLLARAARCLENLRSATSPIEPAAVLEYLTERQ
jgi:hypothetical protein